MHDERVTERGVLTFCYGPRKYLAQAKSLARSIRYRNSNIPLAVVSDGPAADFGGLFDVVIPFDFSAWPGTTAKLALMEVTPFDVTLFIDSDCLSLRSIERLFDYFGTADFAIFGANEPEYPWADGSPHIREVVDAPSYPSFNGGLYFFRRTALARSVFARARQFSDNYDSLGLDRPRGRYNDELLISLAMASMGLRAIDDKALVPMVAPEPTGYAIDIDLMVGRCRFLRRGVMVEPEIVHFVGNRDQLPAYRREQMVLHFIVERGWPRWSRFLFKLIAEIAHFSERMHRWLSAVSGTITPPLLRENPQRRRCWPNHRAR